MGPGSPLRMKMERRGAVWRAGRARCPPYILESPVLYPGLPFQLL